MKPTDRLNLCLTLLVACVIAVATLMPASVASAAPGGDKLHHFLAFALLVLPTAVIRPRWTVAAIVLAILYGWLIELVQPSFGRTYDLADLRADAIGAVIGGLLGLAIGRLVPAAARLRS